MMRRLLTVTLPVVLLIVSGPAALAAWTSTGGSDGSVTATSVNQAAQPTAIGGEGFVTLSWAQSTLASGDPVGHYSVRRDGSEVCTSADTASATASCIDPSPVGQTVTYTVVAVMGAWTGPASAGTSFTYDNTAPGAPSAPDLIAADDTGSSNTDNITNKSNVTVTGTAEAGSTVRIYRGAELLGSGTATGGSYSIGILLVEGENTVHATATDAAGNVSASSTTTLILSDTASPGAPTAPDLIAADDTGPSDSDNVTSKSNVTVQGSAEAGSTVKIYRGTTLLGAGVATGGSYSIGGIALVEGQNDLHATATDEAGNVSTSSTTTIILSDTVAPGAPGTPDLIAAHDTGSSSTDNLTNLTTVTVTGSGEDGSTVRIRRGTTQLGQGTVSGGSYSIAINLVEGANHVFASASDAAGNTSPDSGTTITLDTVAPAQPSTPDLIPADDTGSSNTDNLTNKTSVTVTGDADSGTTVRIYRGTTQLGEATASASGYSVAISPLVEGINTIHATSTDAAGNIAASGTLNITVDTAAPTPAPTTPDLAPGDDSGASNTDNITNKTTVSVTGTAPAGSTVTIYRGTTVMGSGTATGGSYNISITPLTENNNVIHASVSDAAGNTATSGTLTIVRDTTAPTVTRVELKNGSGGSEGTADRGDTVEVQFSEQMDAAKVCPTWTNGTAQTLTGQQGNSSHVIVTITNGSGANSNDSLAVSATQQSGCPSLGLGSLALGRNYVNATATYRGTGGNTSSVTLTTTGLLTVKLGTLESGTPVSVPTPAAPTYTPPSGLTDLAGNALVPTAFNGTSSRF